MDDTAKINKEETATTRINEPMKKESRLTFRLSEDLLDDLIRYALGNNLSLSKAIRTLIEVRNKRAA